MRGRRCGATLASCACGDRAVTTLERRRMADEAETLIVALRRDLVGPADFAP